MNFYVVYDNKFEEFQTPFVLKNDNVAKDEFDTFITNLKEKANTPEEKKKIEARFFLYKFENLHYDKNDDNAVISSDGKFIIKAEPMTQGETNE